jgi:hypothetical protein
LTAVNAAYVTIPKSGHLAVVNVSQIVKLPETQGENRASVYESVKLGVIYGVKLHSICSTSAEKVSVPCDLTSWVLASLRSSSRELEHMTL